ncbi:1-acyl-sn-glycerol-3-phosphate acyltransferase epsilon-like [Anneissia japonica]|uniref:1-acyl-sn-glycerol-3-phosphate acyltransferase epsilon-like n=1 Tax=Anneissia japonica TaxID=1529436 RepID=UPI0014255118|nr:1-acyl-sn-glycerol-3-phosphate acyltransferase epsilon-like [Anneissia japonica]
MLTVIFHINTLRFAVPAVALMGVGPQYLTLILGWRLASVLLPTSWFRAGDDCIWGTYQRFIEFFFEHCTGVEVVLSGDVDDLKKENVLYLSNHQSTMDWIIADMLAIRAGCLGRMRYVLKDGLKYMPLYGFYFGLHGCIYVKRSNRFDQRNINRCMRQLASFEKHKTPVWMVIFPEGTRYNPQKLELMTSSQEFAKKNDLEILHNVLSPRFRATNLCIQGLRKHYDAVYDVTIAYGGTGEQVDGEVDVVNRTTAPSIPDYLMGQCSRVHIHLKRRPLDEVPDDEEGVHRWLHGIFEEKDRKQNNAIISTTDFDQNQT